MNRTIPALMLVGVLVLTTLTIAQNMDNRAESAAPGSAEVAVVDLVRIFNECEQIQHLNEMIRQKQQEIAAEAKQRRERIENLRIMLSAFQPGSKDYETRRKELMQLNIEANVWLQTREQEIEDDKFNWTRVIYEKSLDVVDKIAQERGLDFVAQRVEWKPDEIVDQNVTSLRRVIKERTLVYYRPSLDITDEVIQRLNAAYEAGGGRQQISRPEPSSP